MAVKPNQETLERMRDIFSRVLMTARENIADDADFVYDLDGDSFGYAMIISETEREFKIKVPARRYAKCTTVSDFASLIAEKDAARRA